MFRPRITTHRGAKQVHRIGRVLATALTVAMVGAACGTGGLEVTVDAAPASDVQVVDGVESTGEVSTGDDLIDGGIDEAVEAALDEGDGEEQPADDSDSGSAVSGAGVEPDCAWSGETVVGGNFPAISDGASILSDARMSGQGPVDRFVLEFEETGGPATNSYFINWTQVPPAAGGSGEPVTPLGAWYLEVRVSASMYNFDTGEAYSGPTTVSSPDTTNLVEAVSGGSFEGQMLWVIGAAEPKGFSAYTLEGAPRLVVDVCVGGDNWTEPSPPPGFACAQPPLLPPGAILGAADAVDLDGDGIDEDVYTYYVPAEDRWHLRVEAPIDAFDHVIEDSSGVFESRLLGSVDIDGDGRVELFVEIGGGAYTQGFAVFQLSDCGIHRTSLPGGGAMAFFHGASVSNVLRVECDLADAELETYSAAIAGLGADDEPIGWDVEPLIYRLVDGEWFEQAGPDAASYYAEGALPPFTSDLDCALV